MGDVHGRLWQAQQSGHGPFTTACIPRPSESGSTYLDGGGEIEVVDPGFDDRDAEGRVRFGETSGDDATSCAT